ncbi:DNA-binding protein WhiA [Heliobacterium undosum]|uniref:Probable cell division protein WhiA n=1 Tax=Heliomicrobium undosum TaxID=121734 RepID=A0A845L3G1_9FIRM|nr:DNA-binding protein WhiA [Heliomicrobium undosum]MZP29384.1 DNA-binding protein WhiA [Heliomicrobium undosum]
MSFSVETKEELARIQPRRRCCQLAELAALFRMDGSLQISGEQGVSLTVSTESASSARKIFRLIKAVFGLQTQILVRRKRRLKKSNVYVISLPARVGGRDVLQELGITDSQGIFSFEPPSELLKRQCCRRAYLRGAFLGGGSVNSPEGTYHLEIITNDETHARTLSELLHRFGLTAKVSQRKGWFIVYLKESEQIVEMLSIIGAHSALLNFENVRIVKGMRNQVNRLVNCETANLNKTVDAALRQTEMIQLVQSRVGLGNLPPQLREIAELRLQFPDASLKELGQMLNPPVGKSGVNHRLRRLESLAEEFSRQGGGTGD